MEITNYGALSQSFGDNSPSHSEYAINQLTVHDHLKNEHFEQVLHLLVQFVNSGEAENELTGKAYKSLKKELETTNATSVKKTPKEKWETIKGALQAGAHLAAIGTAVTAFVSAHPGIIEIPKALLEGLFK